MAEEKPALLGQVLRDSNGRIVSGSGPLNPEGRGAGAKEHSRSFRKYLRDKTGTSGEKMWDVLIDIALGRAWIPEVRHPDGTISYGIPQVPSSTDRRMAAQAVLEHMHGRAVPESEIMRAEEASEEMQKIRAMRDEDLLKEIERIRVKKVGQLDPGPIEDVEVVPAEPREPQTAEPVPESRASLFDLFSAR